MGYVILRTQKLKDKGSIRRSLKHSFREQETPNADPDRTPDNSHIGASDVESAMDAISERLNTQEKIRKNAVLAVEYLVTGSPEVLNEKSRKEQDQYFDDALDWMKDKHGAENVVYAGIHRDETTPHLYAYVVPIDERGKLNCRAYLGGSKALNEMQTDFAEKVGKKHDLERGIEGSKAKHKTIQKYYAEIQKETPKLTMPDIQRDKSFFTSETDESFAQRIAEDVAKQAQPAIEKAKMYDIAKERSQQYFSAKMDLMSDARQHRDLTKGLSFRQKQELGKKADELRKANEREKAQAEERKERQKQLERERLDKERQAKRKERDLARRQRSRSRGLGSGDDGLSR